MQKLAEKANASEAILSYGLMVRNRERATDSTSHLAMNAPVPTIACAASLDQDNRPLRWGKPQSSNKAYPNNPDDSTDIDRLTKGERPA